MFCATAWTSRRSHGPVITATERGRRGLVVTSMELGSHTEVLIPALWLPSCVPLAK